MMQAAQAARRRRKKTQDATQGAQAETQERTRSRSTQDQQHSMMHPNLAPVGGGRCMNCSSTTRAVKCLRAVFSNIGTSSFYFLVVSLLYLYFVSFSLLIASR